MKTLMESFTEEGEAEAQPAKKRRVDEYTMRLTAQQWRILEALADGATLLTVFHSSNKLLSWNSVSEWHSSKTITSLVKRNLIDATVFSYQLTDAGRHALRIRRENKQGSGLI